MASYEDVPIVSVMSMSAFAIYWDPETYPNVLQIADLKDCDDPVGSARRVPGLVVG